MIFFCPLKAITKKKKKGNKNKQNYTCQNENFNNFVPDCRSIKQIFSG